MTKIRVEKTLFTINRVKGKKMIELIGNGMALVDGIVFVIEQPKGAGK